jgi:hypothetical protein
VLLDYLFSNTGSAEVEPFPYQVISGSGTDWFYDPVGKMMTEIPRGIEVVQISVEPDSKGRVLVRAPFQFLMIPEKEIVDIGFN